MIDRDNQGRIYAKLSEIKEHDQIQVDGSFTCIGMAATVQVKKTSMGLCVPCTHGMHMLHGQANSDGYIVGMYPVKGD